MNTVAKVEGVLFLYFLALQLCGPGCCTTHQALLAYATSVLVSCYLGLCVSSVMTG